ncbi:MAG TPA: DHA2 family efflux MFS transporter permease subunit [Thermodesulfobacteriota bacterium]|nr:DHA2 family efflux MFS transporter permease subunit [Thermodesulfobacteriota bacterium]
MNQFSSEGKDHKWGVLAVVIVGSFMAILDNNIVNVALPKMMAAFGATVDKIEWVVTGYMIAFAISMPTTNWLKDLIGLSKIFIFSMVFFCIGSALCGLAWDKDSLVVFRVLQAFGGGALMPTGMTLVSEAFPPEERGMAMGMWSIGAMVAPAAGPFVGGYLVDEVSWRSIFYINVPIGAAAALMALWILPKFRRAGAAKKPDIVGFLGFSAFLGFLLVALAQGQREGWNSDYIVGCFSLSMVGLGVFLISGFTVKEPIVDLRLFGNHNFLMASIINLVRAVAIFGSMFLMPLFLQNILDYKALHTGIILAPTAITVAVVSPFSGVISDRIGPRAPLFVGTLLVIYSLYMFKDLSLDSDYWFLFWPQVIRGAGMGLLNAPLMSAAVNAVRREQISVASSLLTVNMQVGGAMGVALLGATLERRQFFHYTQFLERINDLSVPVVAKAQAAMETLLARAGHAPADFAVQGKTLLALWVQRQAAVGAFQDAFILSALLITAGLVPALLIRNRKALEAAAGPAPQAVVSE